MKKTEKANEQQERQKIANLGGCLQPKQLSKDKYVFKDSNNPMGASRISLGSSYPRAAFAQKYQIWLFYCSSEGTLKMSTG